MTEALVVFVVLAILLIIILMKTAVVVPQQNAYVVERLGRFGGVLEAGFHILVPFFDAIRYRHTLPYVQLAQFTCEFIGVVEIPFLFLRWRSLRKYTRFRQQWPQKKGRIDQSNSFVLERPRNGADK